MDRRTLPLLALLLLLPGCNNVTHVPDASTPWQVEGRYRVEYEVQTAPNERAKRSAEDVTRLRFDTHCVVLETGSGEGLVLPLQRLHGLVWKPAE